LLSHLAFDRRGRRLRSSGTPEPLGVAFGSDPIPWLAGARDAADVPHTGGGSSRRSSDLFSVQRSCALSEAGMVDRRDHERLALRVPLEGTVRVLKDVVVEHGTARELVVVSQAPAVVGEDMTLDLMGGAACVTLRVRVLESRPVLVSGTLRHQVRLSVLDSTGRESDEARGVARV
jgi:hypothetical protein